MGAIETGEVISVIRKQKNMTQKDVAALLNVSDKAVSKWERGECYPEVSLLPKLASILEISIDELLTGKKISGQYDFSAENKFSKQYIMEEYNQNYMKGTIISFILIAAALYFSLIRVYMIQAVSIALIFISFCIFYLYDKKYSNLINHQQLEKQMNFSAIQEPCRQFIILTGITAFIFVNLISTDTFLIQGKYFILENKLQYTLMGVTFYTFGSLLLFLKSNKNNSKIPLYFHISGILTILSSLIIIYYQIYINKIGYVNGTDTIEILQNKIDKLFIVLMVTCIFYSLLSFTLHNISHRNKRILFVLSVLQHSLLLSVSRHSISFVRDITTNIHGGINTGYIGIALIISMTLYYIAICISRKTTK